MSILTMFPTHLIGKKSTVSIIYNLIYSYHPVITTTHLPTNFKYNRRFEIIKFCFKEKNFGRKKG